MLKFILPSPCNAFLPCIINLLWLLALGLPLAANAEPNVNSELDSLSIPETITEPATKDTSITATTCIGKPINDDDEPVIISLAAVGDIMLGTDYPKNTLAEDDAEGFLQEVTPLLSAADVALGNLEGVLMDGGTPVKQCQNPNVCFLFRSPTRYAKWLAKAGFDVLSLANNHARDFGEVGRDSSMLALDKVGILHAGRIGDEASWVTKDRKMAMIGFSPNLGSRSVNDIEAGKARVTELAAEHDMVIVFFHGGAEGAGAEKILFKHEIFQGEDRGNVVKFARAMIDAGAAIVLGSGPHVPRAMELYKDRFIAYSLGNFATHYGISIAGIKGIAPLLTLQVDGNGYFLAGQITSVQQLRPDTVQIDQQHQALKLIRTLTKEAFPKGQLQISADGKLTTPNKTCTTVPD